MPGRRLMHHRLEPRQLERAPARSSRGPPPPASRYANSGRTRQWHHHRACGGRVNVRAPPARMPCGGRARGRRRSAPGSSPSALPWPGSQLPARAQSWGRAGRERRSAPGSSASPSSSPAGTDEHAPLRLPYSARRPPSAVLRNCRLNRSSSQHQHRCARHAARRVHSHLGDGGGEGDARRLTLALVRCRPPGSQLLVLSTARSSSPGYHLDVLKPMHAEASSTCAVMGTGVGKATLGFRIPVGFRMLCSESPQISTTDRTHARTGPDTQRAQVRRLRSQFPPCNHAQPSLHS